MLKKILWFPMLFLSVLGIIILAVGFYRAIGITEQASPPALVPADQGTANMPIDTRPSKPADTVSLLIMGDSLARGTGDETGRGFSSYLPDALKMQTPKRIAANTIGIDGLQSQGLLELLQSRKLDPAVADADVLLLSIGGNDLRRVRSANGLTKEDVFRETLAGYLSNVKAIIGGIRKNTGNALIVFIGLYNPYEQGNASDDDRFLLAWNESTQKVIEEDRPAVFIPTYDLFKFNGKRYIAPDGLHPNSAGYQSISARIGKSLEGFLAREQ